MSKSNAIVSLNDGKKRSELEAKLKLYIHKPHSKLPQLKLNMEIASAYSLTAVSVKRVTLPTITKNSTYFFKIVPDQNSYHISVLQPEYFIFTSDKNLVQQASEGRKWYEKYHKY